MKTPAGAAVSVLDSGAILSMALGFYIGLMKDPCPLGLDPQLM